MKMKPCNRSMMDRSYGKDTGCMCNQCRADRRRKRVDALKAGSGNGVTLKHAKR